MKFSPVWYVVFGLSAVIIFMILTRKEQPIDNGYVKEYESKIQSLEAQKAKEDAQVASLFKESESKDSTTKVELRAKDKEISLLKAKLSKQREPLQPLIDSLPELKAFIQTQDSVILVTEQRADTLQMAYTSQIEITRDLKKLIVDKDKIQQEMFTTCSERVDKLQRDYEKEHKRKGVFKKIAGVLGIIVLTETALLIITP